MQHGFTFILFCFVLFYFIFDFDFACTYTCTFSSSSISVSVSVSVSDFLSSIGLKIVILIPVSVDNSCNGHYNYSRLSVIYGTT